MIRNSSKLLWLLPALFAVVAPAQESRGTLSGHVFDPAGASVAGAKVEALNVDGTASSS